MRNSFWDSVRGAVRASNRWFFRTPERALNEAYEAALMIKALEDAHFGGNRIDCSGSSFSRSAQNYFQSELNKYLEIIRLRLAEFKISSSMLRISNRSITEVQLEENTTDVQRINVIDRPGAIVRKLRFIDEVLARYERQPPNPNSVIVISEPNVVAQPTALETNSSNGTRQLSKQPGATTNRSKKAQVAQSIAQEEADRSLRSLTDKTGVLPRSILDTVDRIKRELDPEAEQEILQDFRTSKTRTVIALRFILILIIIPLLTQQVSKNFLVGPIVDQVRSQNPEVAIFLNSEMEEEAMTELRQYEERLRFEMLIGRIPVQEESELREQLRDKAEELQVVYHQRSSDAIKNVFSDILATLAFVVVLLTSRKEIEAIKAFLDQLVYGLSDSAKAFIIILFTDIFVGFHSPHGWEVLLEGISKHLGLPADRNFIFLFIATFPVILDTIFKYWIFRYLNRVSPSAVATYRTMNE